MGTHPNVILLLVLTPDDLVRKTYRSIISEAGLEPEDQIGVGGEEYHIGVMEDDYDEGMQLAAPVGSIVVYDMVTYGYGDVITWDALEAQKRCLEAWAKEICERHHCAYSFTVTANYW